jgi:endonuclease/exonuclease/phosphatase family metal-dependent hydrolase
LPDLPGSVGWDAACTRIVSWILLEDTRTNKKFYVFNTHFDHQGKEARVYSAILLRRKVHEIAGQDQSVIMGDFNATDSSFTYKILTRKLTENTPHFYDTADMSLESPSGPDWTYHGFSPESDKKKLDYIFYTGKAAVSQHTTIIDERFGSYLSDHLPVMVNLTWE